jgi:bifunctional DNA-binding transcriptional regulator/antitoxin component of YhaV-PrlF toxin-antitoxin module
MDKIIGNTRRPDITFYKSGRIDITARVAKLLDINEGDVIDIATDGMEYYLMVERSGKNVVGRHEGRCYKTYGGNCRNMRAYSVRLARAVLKSGDILRLPVGEVEEREGQRYLPIIVRRRL